MTTSANIRVRFAPSPTGPLHIGGIRTALFNFLFARERGGAFLLRIEDTDRERSKPEFEREILESLEWLGLDWDEEPLKQSERLDRYGSAVEALLQKDAAYREKDSQGRSAVKFRVPKRRVEFQDLVHGVIGFDSALFDDFVIQKSDGFPTYLLACVVDDHEMNISHVIRGDDHISNTPRQILLYEVLGFNPPEFAHLPLVFGADKTPLSKRHGTVSFESYRRAGYLPWGLLNYLALLGWAPGGNREYLSREELIRQFRLDRIHATNACFDLEKLKWLNAEHIRSLDQGEYVKRAEEFFKRYHPQALARAGERFRVVALLYKDRIRIFEELYEQALFFFQEEVSFDPAAVEKYLKDDRHRTYLEEWRQALAREGDFSSVQGLEILLRQTAERLAIEAKMLIHPTRVAITGRSVSPGLFDTMQILGKDTVVKRLAYVTEHYSELVK